jgi:hypothetical protein
LKCWADGLRGRGASLGNVLTIVGGRFVGRVGKAYGKERVRLGYTGTHE